MKLSQVLEMNYAQQMTIDEMKKLDGGVIPTIIVAGGGLIAALVSSKIFTGIAIFLSGFIAGAVTYGTAQLIKNKSEQAPKA
jgi:hypothetical protein